MSLTFTASGFTDQAQKAARQLGELTEKLRGFIDVAGGVKDLPASMQRAVASLTKGRSAVAGLGDEQRILSEEMERQREITKSMGGAGGVAAPITAAVAPIPLDDTDKVQQSLSGSQDHLACINNKLTIMKSHWANIGTEADLFQGSLKTAQDRLQQMGIRFDQTEAVTRAISEQTQRQTRTGRRAVRQQQTMVTEEVRRLQASEKRYKTELKYQQTMGRLTARDVSFALGQQGMLERIALRIFGVKQRSQAFTDQELKHQIDIQRTTRRWRKDLIGASFILSVIGWKLKSMNQSFIAMSMDLSSVFEDIHFYWEDIADIFGEAIAPVLESVILPIFEKVVDIVEQLPMPVRALVAGLFMAVIGVIAFAGPLLGMVSTIKMIRSAWQSYVVGIEQATRKQQAHSKAIGKTMQTQAKSGKSMSKGIGMSIAGVGVMLVLMTIMQPLMEALTPLFDILGDILAGMIEPLEPIIEAFADMVETSGLMEMAVGAVNTILTALSAIFTVISDAMKPLMESLFGTTDATELFAIGLKMMLTPLAITIEVVAGLILALAWVIKQLVESEKVVNFFKISIAILLLPLRILIGFLQFVWDVITAFTDALRNNEKAMNAIKYVLEAVLMPFRVLWEIIKLVLGVVLWLIDALFGSGLHAALEAVWKIIELILIPFKIWWSIIKLVIDVVVWLAKELFGSGLHAALEAVFSVVGFLGPLFEGFVGFISMVIDAVKWLADILTDVLGPIGDVVGALGDVINLGADVIGGVGGFLGDVGGAVVGVIPDFHEGGLVSKAGLAMVHEGEVLPSGAGDTGFGGGVTINLTVQGNMTRETMPELEYRMSEVYRNEMKRRTV